MLACVSTCGHADMCWYVPTCVNMWNHPQHLWSRPFELYLACWHVSAHMDMPTCADMCRHVPTCAIYLNTSDNDHLHLIWMLACVSICGHADVCWYVPICADMCQHVKPPSAPLIIGIIGAENDVTCRHMSAHVCTCRHVTRCRHMPTCAGTYVPASWLWHSLVKTLVCQATFY